MMPSVSFSPRHSICRGEPFPCCAAIPRGKKSFESTASRWRNSKPASASLRHESGLERGTREADKARTQQEGRASEPDRDGTPDPDRAKAAANAEQVAERKCDQPVSGKRDQCGHLDIADAAQRRRANHLSAIDDLKQRGDDEQLSRHG